MLARYLDGDARCEEEPTLAHERDPVALVVGRDFTGVRDGLPPARGLRASTCPARRSPTAPGDRRDLRRPRTGADHHGARTDSARSILPEPPEGVEC